jgi:apolipoprotein N-acyltransferase
VIDGTGALIAAYDKFHLVPFGEYVPFRWILKFNQIVADRADFATGPGPRTLHLANLPPAGAIICYEAIFPHAVADETDRPQWLVNVTNDAWFGTSTGPYQHFAMVRVRAIEEGVPLVRAANSGISGVIDPQGRVIASIGLGLSGFVDAPLPQALAPTPYGRWGDGMLLALLAPLSLACILRSRRRR